MRPDGVPDFPRGHTKVYDEHILLRTWMALRDLSELEVPGSDSVQHRSSLRGNSRSV